MPFEYESNDLIYVTYNSYFVTKFMVKKFLEIHITLINW
jgi:hypothetical protein